jgi:hypothetical protein
MAMKTTQLWAHRSVPFAAHFAFLGLLGMLDANCCLRKRCKDFAKMIKQDLNHHVHTAPCIYPLLEWSHSIYVVSQKLGTCRSGPAAQSFTDRLFGQT